MGTLCLEMCGVSRWRGDARVLRDIHWRVERGQHWAVLGPNGSGKSTLVSVATGYEPASRGDVYLLVGWMGEICLPELRREIGFVSAQISDFLLRHVEGCTGLNCVLSGAFASIGLYEEASERQLHGARRIMRRLGILPLAERTFETLSTGERQLCLLGRSAMARTRLTILDEPCAGLDVVARERLLEAVADECRSQPDVPHILITHHPEEILPQFTHVLLLRKGRVLACGPRREVLTRPNLEAAFGAPLRMARERGRLWIRVRHPRSD